MEKRTGADVLSVKQRRPRLKPSVGTAVKVMKFKNNLSRAVKKNDSIDKFGEDSTDSSDAEMEDYGHPCGRRTSTKEQAERIQEVANYYRQKVGKDMATPTPSPRTQNDDLRKKKRSTADNEDDMWPIEELLRVEAGQPCIQDGVCVLCCNQVNPRQWGLPRCRGCSIVDAMSFE